MLLTAADLSVCQQDNKPCANPSKDELKKYFNCMAKTQKIKKQEKTSSP